MQLMIDIYIQNWGLILGRVTIIGKKWNILNLNLYTYR